MSLIFVVNSSSFQPISTATMPTTLKHRDLGDVKGNTKDSAIEFRGIKYASLENRFAEPSLVTDYGSGALDATKFGYAALPI